MHFLKLIFLHFSHSFNQEPHEHSPKSGFYSSSIFLVLREAKSDRFPGFSRFNLICQRGHSDKMKQFSKTAPFQKLFFHVLCKFPKISLKNSLHNQIFFFLKYPTWISSSKRQSKSRKLPSNDVPHSLQRNFYLLLSFSTQFPQLPLNFHQSKTHKKSSRNTIKERQNKKLQ